MPKKTRKILFLTSLFLGVSAILVSCTTTIGRTDSGAIGDGDSESINNQQKPELPSTQPNSDQPKPVEKSEAETPKPENPNQEAPAHEPYVNHEAEQGAATAEPELFNPQNQQIALKNIKLTANKIRTIYDTSLSIANQIEAKIDDSNTNQKNAFKAFLANLAKINDKFQAGGAIGAKVVALNHVATNYDQQLTTILSELKTTLTEFQNAFTTFASMSSSNGTVNDLTKYADFIFWSEMTLLEVSKETPFDLARNFETSELISQNSQEISARKTTPKFEINFVAQAANASNHKLFYDYVKFLGIKFDLMLKRQAQTIAIAKIIEAKLTNEQVKASFAKQSKNFASRNSNAYVHEHFIKKVNDLAAKIVTLKTQFASAKLASTNAEIALTANDQKLLVDAELEITKFEKIYSGLDTASPKFLQPGMKNLTAKLTKLLKELPNKNIEKIQEFNYFFAKTSETWDLAEALTINIKNFALSIEKMFDNIAGYMRAVEAKVNQHKTTAPKKAQPYENFYTILGQISTTIQNLVSELKLLNKPVEIQSHGDNKYSVNLLNQHVNAITSLAQLFLMQVVVDQLKDSINPNEILLAI